MHDQAQGFRRSAAERGLDHLVVEAEAYGRVELTSKMIVPFDTSPLQWLSPASGRFGSSQVTGYENRDRQRHGSGSRGLAPGGAFVADQ